MGWSLRGIALYTSRRYFRRGDKARALYARGRLVAKRGGDGPRVVDKRPARAKRQSVFFDLKLRMRQLFSAGSVT